VHFAEIDVGGGPETGIQLGVALVFQGQHLLEQAFMFVIAIVGRVYHTPLH